MRHAPIVVVLVLAAAWTASRGVPPKSPAGEMNVAEAARIPVAYQGRTQPLDTLARNMLRSLSGRQTFEDREGNQRAAIVWLLDTATDFAHAEPRAIHHRVFRIENYDVLTILGLSPREGLRYAIAEFQAKLPEIEKQGLEAQRKKDAKEPLDLVGTKMLELYSQIHLYSFVAQPQFWYVTPPRRPEGDWVRLGDAGTGDPAARSFVDMLMAYAHGDAAEFNKHVAAHLAPFDAGRAEETKKARFEAWFNHVEPFYVCSVLYVFAFLLTAIFWLTRAAPLNRSALALIALTFVVHTAALAARIHISGRPPVTNLYSSAVFIGWFVVLAALLLEPLIKHGFGNVVGAVAGFATLLIAHFLAEEGDTFAVLQAVLDTQFWLATHVVCITIGYATTYIAGLLAIIQILHFGLTPEQRKTLSKAVYGVVCFATFFSFVGTVLGGLWADDSWGRFWGWDPKENGALMIVLWNALVLHARWGNMVRERGLAMLAVFGNIVVSWSWFGVNQLGVGLHSYGFTSGVALWLFVFAGSQAAIMAIGLIPRREAA